MSIEILHSDLLSHPAVVAWHGLRHTTAEPERIEVLKQKKKRAAYRLTGIGPENSVIIAKSARQAKAMIERTINEEVLPRLDRSPPNPDFSTYLAIVRNRWPSFDVLTIQQLANLGQMFWSLKVISRSLPVLTYKPTYIKYVMDNFRIYEAALADSIHSATWES